MAINQSWVTKLAVTAGKSVASDRVPDGQSVTVVVHVINMKIVPHDHSQTRHGAEKIKLAWPNLRFTTKLRPLLDILWVSLAESTMR